MPLFRRLATLAAAAEAARRYARSNPDKAAKYLDQAAAFVDKQTKGRYSGQINGVAQRAKSVAGIPTTPGYGAASSGTGTYGAAGNGHSDTASDLGTAPTYGETTPIPTPKPRPGPAQP